MGSPGASYISQTFSVITIPKFIVSAKAKLFSIPIYLSTYLLFLPIYLSTYLHPYPHHRYLAKYHGYDKISADIKNWFICKTIGYKFVYRTTANLNGH